MTAKGATTYSAASGTPDLVALASLCAMLAAGATLGWPALAARAWDRRQALLARLADGPAGTLLGPSDPAQAAAMCCTALPAGKQPGDIAQRLHQDHQIVVHAISHGPLRGLRWSPWLYTSDADLDRATTALATILR